MSILWHSHFVWLSCGLNPPSLSRVIAPSRPQRFAQGQLFCPSISSSLGRMYRQFTFHLVTIMFRRGTVVTHSYSLFETQPRHRGLFVRNLLQNAEPPCIVFPSLHFVDHWSRFSVQFRPSSDFTARVQRFLWSHFEHIRRDQVSALRNSNDRTRAETRGFGSGGEFGRIDYGHRVRGWCIGSREVREGDFHSEVVSLRQLIFLHLPFMLQHQKSVKYLTFKRSNSCGNSSLIELISGFAFGDGVSNPARYALLLRVRFYPEVVSFYFVLLPPFDGETHIESSKFKMSKFKRRGTFYWGAFRELCYA